MKKILTSMILFIMLILTVSCSSVFYQKDDLIETSKKYAFVVGDNKPSIKLV